MRQHQDKVVIVAFVAAIDDGIAEHDHGLIFRQTLIKGDFVVGHAV